MYMKLSDYNVIYKCVKDYVQILKLYMKIHSWVFRIKEDLSHNA